MQNSYDVIVAGGGSAGIAAAVQSARAGATTLLIEKSGILGGTTTNGGVNFPGLFHAWGHQVIAGIGWELVEKAVMEAGDTLPDFSNWQQRHWKLQIPINIFLYAALCDEALQNAGADVLFHSMPASVMKLDQQQGWQLTVCNKSGLSEITAKVLVDCTGDANLTALAGFPLNSSEDLQPATLSCLASGYDFDTLNLEQINASMEQAVQAGELEYTDASWNATSAQAGNWLSKYGENASHIHGINAGSSESRSRLEIEARLSLLRLYRFLRKQPGLSNLKIDRVSPECGVRETFTIQGKKSVKVEDYTSGRIWEDAVCYSYYPIDLHQSSGAGLNCQPLEQGKVPTIPRGAMLPANSQYLIVAGRCISSDQLANSALRVQASCMAMGQAAGAMAALSASTGLDPEALDLDKIHTLLSAHGAIIPE